MNDEKVLLYSTSAIASGGGRSGSVESNDPPLKLDLATPPELGGSGGGTNPEQLFAAGFAACFKSALMAVGRAQKVDVSGATVTVTIGLLKAEDGYDLSAKIAVSFPEGLGDTEALVLAASNTCPYSRAVKGNVVVDIELDQR